MKKAFQEETVLKNLKNRIQKHLDRGNSRLVWLEDKITDKKNRQMLKEELSKAKEKMAELRKSFKNYEEKAVQYTQRNPKKALAMAAAAGVLTAGLWATLRGKRNAAAGPLKLKKKRSTKSPKKV